MSKIKMAVRLVTPQASLFGFCGVIFMYTGVPPMHVCVQISSYKCTRHYALGPTLRTLF